MRRPARQAPGHADEAADKAKFTMARLRNHVVPLLGHKRVTATNVGDIERLVRDVTAGKTARDEKIGPRKRIIVRGGEGIAQKVVRDLSDRSRLGHSATGLPPAGSEFELIVYYTADQNPLPQ